MSTSDDTLVLETPQGENVAGEAVDTPVHPVDQKGGAAAGTQPVEISGSEPSTISDGGAAQVDVVSTKDPSCVLPTPQYDDGSMEYEYAGELEIDPDTYVVMQRRKQAKPNPKKIGEMVAAYDRGVVFPIPDVYQDWDTAERFAPDSVSDLVHADIFAELYRHEFAFVPEWGWMWFNGKYWEGGEHKVLEMAGEVVKRRIDAHKRAIGTVGEKDSRPLNKLESFSNESRLRGMLGIVKAKLHVPATKFDADPYLLNAGNGVVNLRTGELAPHAPEQHHTCRPNMRSFVTPD